MHLYAALSLTVVRMLPVAVALLGAGFNRFSVVAHGFSAVPLANRFRGAPTKAAVDSGDPA